MLTDNGYYWYEVMKQKTPDQIRRETVPQKHLGLIYGLLGFALGAVLSFGEWALFDREQVVRYPEYCADAIRVSADGFSATRAPGAGMSADRLRYEILRWGNHDHRFDGEILRHGWYPRGASAADWVRVYGGVESVYQGKSAIEVLRWPVMITSLIGLLCTVLGLVGDYRYQSAIVSGVQFDGSIVATVDEYNREVNGDGMRYRVRPWSNR